MPDLTLVHKPALADVRYGHFGNKTPTGPGIRLHARPETCLLHVIGAPGCADIAALLGTNPAYDIRIAGPYQWFIVSDVALTASAVHDLETRLGDRAAISDQTHGRVRIAVSGPDASALLAKGTAIDLDPLHFPADKSGMTLIGHIAVNLARTGPEAFEVTVLRGFAESLWNDLIHMGLEYGVDCIPAPSHG